MVGLIDVLIVDIRGPAEWVGCQLGFAVTATVITPVGGVSVGFIHHQLTPVQQSENWVIQVAQFIGAGHVSAIRGVSSELSRFHQ
jgi:hypothetical protein